jgi:DNA-binding protein H-NS
MNNTQINQLSLKELVALDEKIQKALVIARVRARSEVKQRIAEMASQHGFSLNELFDGKAAGKNHGGVARYENPADRSQTWTGRGRKPNWVIAGLKKGASLEDFAI